MFKTSRNSILSAGITDHSSYLKQNKKSDLIINLMRVALLAGILVIWEGLAAFGIIDPFVSSSPSRIWTVMLQQIRSGDLWVHILTTTGEAIIGFTGGTLGGILIAIVLWWSRFISRVLEPYLVILNAMPKSALGPLFIIWFKTGTPAIIAMALAISMITTIMMVYSGFKNVDSDKIKLSRSFGARKWQVLWKVVIPASFPTMIAALKVNVGLSWVGVIVGEFLVSRSGLGYLAIYGGQILNFSLVMMSTMFILIEAGLMYGGVAYFEKWYQRRIS